MRENDAECIACKSPIRSDAKVCLECNGRQNWTRFLDVGNTAVALLIAAFSVIGLAIAPMIQAYGYFFLDAKLANLTVNVDGASPSKLSLFIGNDGPGIAVISSTVRCEVWTGNVEMARSGISGKANQDKLREWRHYFYAFPQTRSFMMQPGTSQIFELDVVETGALFRNSSVHMPAREDTGSDCYLSFKHQSGGLAEIKEEIEDTLSYVLAIAFDGALEPAPSSTGKNRNE